MTWPCGHTSEPRFVSEEGYFECVACGCDITPEVKAIHQFQARLEEIKRKQVTAQVHVTYTEAKSALASLRLPNAMSPTPFPADPFEALLRLSPIVGELIINVGDARKTATPSLGELRLIRQTAADVMAQGALWVAALDKMIGPA